MVEKLLKDKRIEYCESDVNAFMDMAKMFKHWKGTTKRIELDMVQKWIVACVLGIKIQDKNGDWVRYFKECRIFVAKKFGKSVLMALFAMWGLLFDKHREGAEVYCIATKKEQAKIVLENVRVYRKQNPQIAKICKEVYEAGDKYIFCDDNNGVIKALSSSKNGLQGKNPSWVMFDEAQEVKDFEVIEAVRTGMATRKQPMFVSMSTAGVTPDSAYHQMYSQIEVMCEQKKFDDKARVFFAVFEIDITDSIDDKSCWIKANPSLLDGRPTLEHLEREYALAKIGDGDKSLPKFIAFHLNRSCDGAHVFYSQDLLKNSLIEISTEHYYDSYAYGGVDLSETTDFTVATAIIPYRHINSEVYDFYVLQRYFKAENRLEKDSDTDRVIYKEFMNTKSNDPLCNELLYACKGDTVRFHDVAEWFRMLRDEYKICFRKIGYDKAWANTWLTIMTEFDPPFTIEKVDWENRKLIGFDDGQLTIVAQGHKLSDVIKLSKALFEENRIKIDKHNKMLLFCLSNVKVVSDKDNQLAISKRQSNGRIDGAASLMCALRAWTRDKSEFEHILQYSDCNKYK